MNSGKHVLVLSFSGFDPTRTLPRIQLTGHVAVTVSAALRKMMTLRSIPAPLWMAAALFPMVVSQIVRLQQSDPAAWIFWDYAGRLGTLAILGVIPAARAIAFRIEPFRMPQWEASIWIVGIVLADHYVGGWIRRTMNAALPSTVLGTYPETHGWLHFFDIVFGLALVALSEEIIFRRCARHLFQNYLEDGYALVCVTSLLFGAYHWWTGVGNIGEVVLIGWLLMLLYRRSGALWPAVLAHYLTDIVDFAF
ncbi:MULTISPECIES: CPBP family intramembrane glutamic endopeptidase [Bradyrhizobium]|uniref:CAAX protease self-immunity n=2 Tax=Bradyrhizobium TaxID=374 RepID=A0ABY0QCA4_9BRAD|nr:MULTISPECIES: type II CAAX endopeptidase family protein [Bradyrhizobium]SDJ90024.1 CAAX protease self-immunity [Bradyrhizobium ottawaense]SEC01486.1 CAAX protease self-immunity [Bradyrhizobium lablabi]